MAYMFAYNEKLSFFYDTLHIGFFCSQHGFSCTSRMIERKHSPPHSDIEACLTLLYSSWGNSEGQGYGVEEMGYRDSAIS
jgi:hypothetical protein